MGIDYPIIGQRIQRLRRQRGMTQEQLASVFGVHRATLARAIQHLKQEAIIACFTCRRVEIIDMERLRHMAHL